MHTKPYLPWIFAGSLLWIWLWNIPGAVDPNDYDSSWQIALGHLLRHGLQAGVDYAYTYGPLGFFATNAPVPGLFTATYLWELSTRLIYVVMFCAFARSMPRHGWLWVAAVWQVYGSSYDTVYLTLITMIALRTLREDPWRVPYLVGGVGTIAVFSLVKFTFLALGLVAMGFILVSLALARRYGAIAAVLASYVGTFAVAWTASGQAFTSLLPYLRSSFAIAKAYPETLMLWRDNWALVEATAILALVGWILFFALKESVTSRRDRLSLFFLAIMLACVFKHGFTRQDAHVALFFTYVAWVVGVLPAIFREVPWGSRRFALPVALLFIIAIPSTVAGLRFSADYFRDEIALRFHDKWRWQIQPWRYKREIDLAWSTARERVALPKLRALVGQNRIDSFPLGVGVLLANEFNWAPRLVFQTQSAVDAELIARTTQAYLRADAPPYVLLQDHGFFAKYPVTDGATNWLALLTHYSPVASERNFTLFKRKSENAERLPLDHGKRLHYSTTWDHEIIIIPTSNRARWMRVVIRPSWLGRLRALFLRPATVEAVVIQTDMTVFGYPLVPAHAAAGVLIDPIIRDEASLVDFLSRGRAYRPWKMKFKVADGSRADFADNIEVTVQELDESFPRVRHRITAPRLSE